MTEPKPLTKEDVHKKVKIDEQFRLVEEYCYAYKVKSAVEWLNENIDFVSYNEFNLTKVQQKLIKDEFKNFVKEAFEGVMQDNEVEEK